MNEVIAVSKEEANSPMWNQEQIDVIRAICAPKLNNTEFLYFLNVAKMSGLNPLRKEIWAVKYDGRDPQIFVGRDGYRTLLGRNPDYDFTLVDAVYSNDVFERNAENHHVMHKYNLQDRGKLLGAYAIVKLKSKSRPAYIFVPIEEYKKKNYSGKPGLWDTHPSTMIKKVAESQAIRLAIPEQTNGTYCPEEFDRDSLDVDQKIMPRVKQAVPKTIATPNQEIIEHEDPVIKKEKIENLKELLLKTQRDQDRITQVLHSQKVDVFEDLTLSFIEKWIHKLK
jgi:phage recombination protein Bet